MRLSVILPTYNEAQNLPELLDRVMRAVAPHEVIVVDDDSPDRTWLVAEDRRSTLPGLRVMRRTDKKGLSSAVVDGCDAATGDILVVMDSDLQHDPAVIVQLVQGIEQGAGIAVASRYREGGSVGEWVTGRRMLSRAGTFLARKLPNVETTDPMSGFFAVRADLYRSVRDRLQPEGFKILFELLAALPRGTRLAEVPLVFHPRLHGESKLSLRVQVQFAKQVVRIGLQKVGLTGGRAFVLACAAIGLFLFLRLVPILSLYTDAALRRTTQDAVTSIAAEHGWPLSDVRITQVSDGGFTMEHRRHTRGIDAVECYAWSFDTSSLVPCGDE